MNDATYYPDYITETRFFLPTLQGISTFLFTNILKLFIMSNLLYTVAVILIVLWAIGFLGFHMGGIIHLLLVIAVVAVLLRVIRGGRI